MGSDRTDSDLRTAVEVRGILDAEPGLSRTALSRRLCETLGWRSPNGRLQEMRGRTTLAGLERAGVVQLPPARRVMPRKRNRRSRDPRFYRMPDSIIVALPDLGELRMVRVTAETPDLSATWNELTARHHYLGCGPLCGRQLRYLVESEHHGTVATLAFTSAALYLQCRDTWIGWDDEARQLHLGQVVCNARFLILPWVKVKNLASKVLSLCPERVRDDWRSVYGVEPVLLETFVDRKRFKATSYLAAGWEQIGETKGRGRQDREKLCPVRRKAVLVRPLRDDCREILKATPPKPPRPVYVTQDDDRDWTRLEFATADLGDRRLNERLIRLASAFFADPAANIPEACGSTAAARAAYRFMKHEDVSMQKILAPHFEATAGRIAAGAGVVLAVQDTTYLNYSAHPDTDGLGPIGSTAEGPVGIVLHDTMAFSPDGTPLGLVHVRCWVRDPDDFGSSEDRKDLPIEEKESVKWLESYSAASDLQRRVPHVRIISTGDREADIYELFEKAANTPGGAQILVRVQHNRKLLNECAGLKDTVAAWPVREVLPITVPRRGKQGKRVLDMELRFGTVTILAPGKGPRRPPLAVQVVHVLERDHEGPGDPVEWFLMTTCPVDTVEQATEVVEWYTKRWGIEIYHRVIKSGCRIEDRQLSAEDRLEACLAIDLVVAWRVFHLTMLGRECPSLPASVCLEETEWKVLCMKYTGTVPDKPPSLRQTVLWVGRLGGYIARPKDYLPGTVTIWRGLVKLQSMAEGWHLALALGMPAGP